MGGKGSVEIIPVLWRIGKHVHLQTVALRRMGGQIFTSTSNPPASFLAVDSLYILGFELPFFLVTGV